MIRKLLLCVFLLFSGILHAQIFTGLGGAIPDNGNSVTFPLTVSGLTPTALDTLFGLEGVQLDILHTYDSDLDIWLISPDSTWIELSTGNGGSGHDYTNTFLFDSCTNIISNGAAPFNGFYRPESPIYAVNNGQNPNGVWQLYVHDTYAFADSGVVLGWHLIFGTHPGIPFNFTSSNLPIVKISTLGQQIVDSPKIFCNMKIIDNGAGIRNNTTDTVFTYDGFIGIEIRGSSSQSFPKKSFGLETEDSTGSNLNVSLMGMPAENDWILNANYSDKTLLRNMLSQDIFTKMGHYSSRTQPCEVLINGIYQGVYIFMEKIKRDANRVDISKLTAADTSGDALTGGYILKIDKFTGSGGAGWTTLYTPPSGGPAPFVQYEYPASTDILPVQEQYIHSYVDSFETALHSSSFANPTTGYAHFIETGSFIDYFILNEFAKNVDGYRLSSYFYKKKDSKGGKLTMGPAWDYDIAWKNANYYNGNLQAGWDYPFPNNSDPFQVPFWWSRFLQDPNFANALHCRWTGLRSTILSNASLTNWVDSMATYLSESEQRNFQVWPILGTYVWPNPNPIPANYAGEITALKAWLTQRAAWMDASMPGVCSGVGMDDISGTSNEINVYPNPAIDEIIVTIKTTDVGPVSYAMYDVTGRIVSDQKSVLETEKTTFRMNLSKVPSGIYLLSVKTANRISETKVVKQ
jgi:hypothetical protein